MHSLQSIAGLRLSATRPQHCLLRCPLRHTAHTATLSAGGHCAPGCACANCYNHEGAAEAVAQARAVVLAKDPRAFETKVRAGQAALVA